jgi:hypothetical protein
MINEDIENHQFMVNYIHQMVRLYEPPMQEVCSIIFKITATALFVVSYTQSC